MGLLDKLRAKNPKRNKDTGNAIERYAKSFCHALNGIVYCMREEHNMIIILLATIVAVTAGFFFKISCYEWLFIILVCGMIAAVEMINSAIEATVDLVTTQIHPLAKIAKDTASSATLTLSFVAFVGSIIIFLPKIMEML